MTASLLGFKGVVNNSIDATTSRDDLIEFVSSLTILMLNLSRIAEDFILWSTSEFGFIEVPDSYSSTSSLMPQKKNPDTLELIRAKAAVVSSNLFAMISIIKGLPSGYSRDLQELKPEITRSSRLAQDSLGIFAGIVIDLKINSTRMKEAARNSYAISIDIAERLVLEKGISFRSAHYIVGSLVKKAVLKGSIPLSMLTCSEIRSVMEKTNLQIDPSDVFATIQNMSPERSVELRLSSGSTSIVEQQNQFGVAIERKRIYEQQTSEREKYLATAFANLLKMVKNRRNIGQ
jgi:argininosuccinate lyase